jgi:hypothetical protein
MSVDVTRPKGTCHRCESQVIGPEWVCAKCGTVNWLQRCVVWNASARESGVDLFFRIAFGCAWGALVLVWAWGWRISKATSHRAEGLNSLTPYLPVLIGVALLKMHVLPESWIKEPLWPHSLALEASGLAVTVLGAGFAIWSRVTLGRNWSSVPQVKEQHELVVKGTLPDRPPSHLHRPDSGGRRHWAGPGQGNRVIHGGAGFCQLLAQKPRGRKIDDGNLP